MPSDSFRAKPEDDGIKLLCEGMTDVNRTAAVPERPVRGYVVHGPSRAFPRWTVAHSSTFSELLFGAGGC